MQGVGVQATRESRKLGAGCGGQAQTWGNERGRCYGSDTRVGTKGTGADGSGHVAGAGSRRAETEMGQDIGSNGATWQGQVTKGRQGGQRTEGHGGLAPHLLPLLSPPRLAGWGANLTQPSTN